VKLHIIVVTSFSKREVSKRPWWHGCDVFETVEVWTLTVVRMSVIAMMKIL
jgi:hypothetical protein